MFIRATPYSWNTSISTWRWFYNNNNNNDKMQYNLVLIRTHTLGNVVIFPYVNKMRPSLHKKKTKKHTHTNTPGGGLRFICFSTSFCSSFSFSASSSISLTRALIASSSCNTDTNAIRAVSPSWAQYNSLEHQSQCGWLLRAANKCWPTTKSSHENVIINKCCHGTPLTIEAPGRMVL